MACRSAGRVVQVALAASLDALTGLNPLQVSGQMLAQVRHGYLFHDV